MPGSPYTDLDRPPLQAAGLRRALLVPGGLWTALELHAETASTNADAAAAARRGAPEGLIVVAERQTAGRGRLGRRWESPARAGLAVSVLLRPGLAGIPAKRYGWLPLLAGLALAETVVRLGEVDASVKWPNDVLVGDRKCGGILAEVVGPALPGGDAVVIGIGLNVSVRVGELPDPEATSLQLAGAECTDREPLLRALLRALASWYLRWREAAGDPESSRLRAEYLASCGTLDREVR
ncbi:MAG TPA: biotin--[acetyl-CoA-carboxylase] ligase, partial [Micromonosporaceae bacterium]|nr:biotin--[acetyl-CoA-carboxylase] ligase [Micromonosporaceae bacterium]